mgnify:FL=1
MHMDYLFGLLDEETKSRYLFGWKCFNEDCEQSFDACRQLWQDLSPLIQWSNYEAADVEVETALSVSTELRDDLIAPQLWPGDTVPLTSLELDHPAITYLTQRHYDPVVLQEKYGVQFCTRGRRYKVITDRILIPFYRGGNLIGWQAREVPGMHEPTEMKYFTSPNTLGGLVYGLGTAKNYPVCCLVEGFFDRAAVGDASMALLTKKISSTQLQRIKKVLLESGVQVVVVLLDPTKSPDAIRKDQEHHIELVKKQLEAALCEFRINPIKVLDCYLPDDLDPADFVGTYGKSGFISYMQEFLRLNGYSNFGQVFAGGVLSGSAIRH